MDIKNFLEFIIEDTSAVGGPSVGGGDGGGGGEAYSSAATLGMGPVVSAQPSSFSGTTIGSDWSRGGGTIGSGDINANFKKTPFMKNIGKNKNHGSTRSKKGRNIRFNVKNLIPKKSNKVLNFDDFQKKNIEKVTKVKD